MLKVIKVSVSDFSQSVERRVSQQNVSDIRIPRTYYQTLSHFRLADQQVSVLAGKTPHISNGDEIVLAGYKVFGEIKALAFHNLSQNVRWGNNLGHVLLALVLLVLSLILSPQRLLQLHIIDIQTYLNLSREAHSPFSMWKPFFEILPHLQIALGLFSGFLLLTGLPKLIAYLQVKDA